MAILDIFKHKKAEPKKRKQTTSKITKTAKPVVAIGSDSLKVEKAVITPKKETVGQKRSVASVHNIISEPHISEKATNSGAINQYVFEIFNNANKPMVKEAIEIIYNVNVLSVNIINIPPKKRRMGRTEGFRKAYKKAIVKIGADQKIEII